MDAPSNDVLKIEKVPTSAENGFIAIATINRPNKLNALNDEVMNSLKALCKWVEDSSDIRCLVVTGAQPLPAEEGKRTKPNAFVAGADITEFVGMNSAETKIKFSDNGVEALWNLTKPTIAMIDGFALGGGCEVACSCDIRIASERSKFGTPEINLGLIPGYGATQRLSKLIGYGKTLEMIMTGEMLSAEEAAKIGLVNHVCSHEQLFELTIDMAQKIASKSVFTLAAAKRTIKASLNNSLDEGVKIEAEEFANLFDSNDKEEGVKAFIERSTPKWSDS